MEVLVELLKQAYAQVEIKLIEKYIHQLEMDIDAFNILGIDQNLKEFQNKIQLIEDLIEEA